MGLLRAFQEGGVFMYFILIFGIFTVAFIAERAKSLFFGWKDAPQDFRNQLLGFWTRGDLNGASQYALTAGAGTALGAVASVGLQVRTSGGGEEELQARMDEKLTEEISKIDRRTGFLGMFGNVATLLGLLGTISGMIQSFAAVASANPADRATLLSKGISEAMNCTAFGLLVAIPSLVAYAIYQNRTDKLVASLTESVTRIYHDLVFLTESTQVASKTSALGATKAQSVAPAPTVSM